MPEPLIVAVPREIMPCEGRVPIFPDTIPLLKKAVTERRIKFVVEEGLGRSLGIKYQYWRPEAMVARDKDILYRAADIVLKVKQPFPEEIEFYREGQGLICFPHVHANKETVGKLLAKGVKILPYEYYPTRHDPHILSTMSREAGHRIVDLLNEHQGRTWRNTHIFFGGARGVVCRHAIAAALEAGVPTSKIHAFDIVSGLFKDPESGATYETLSTEDSGALEKALKKCGILVLAAVTKGFGAPKFLKRSHLEFLPNDAFILQVSIDEGGNIDDEEFCQLTFGHKPIYTVVRGITGLLWSKPRRITVCNLPDIPGIIRPEESSRSLINASFPYLVEILQTWPDVPDKYLVKIF
ncbi:MAG: hypothetical protein HYW89_00995 [Candidatus Sungiibacteriota bacterium]|uniref:Alanine dehydrogenase/pyridine nucleotide transhydrogenase N-terminal domain-containing protein n=1 Tax=Candidatus Sungiibacteriota bacterium TaxID=2750080 RepID=A0A7T5URG5_9BACT|nr:MAG: hypothetical protein HYW89_00995 [Candidatus Sungbacteria bacterium]